MKIKAFVFSIALLLALALQSAQAGIVGVSKITVPAHSDAQFSVPYTQDIKATLTVASVAGANVTVNEAVPASSYAANVYYVRILTGSGTGLWSTITANSSANVLTLESSAVAGYLSNGNTIRVYKHQTLGSVFTSVLHNISYVNLTQVLIFNNDLSIIGKNKAASQTATWSDSQNKWLGSGISNDTILKPETRLILRNGSNNPLTLVLSGVAADYPVSMLIAANDDLNIGTGYPVPVVLNLSGLGDTNLRQVLLYDNTTTGVNKAASKTATWSSSQNKWLGSGITGYEPVGAGEAVTLRLPSTEPVVKITIDKPY